VGLSGLSPQAHHDLAQDLVIGTCYNIDPVARISDDGQQTQAPLDLHAFAKYSMVRISTNTCFILDCLIEFKLPPRSMQYTLDMIP